MGNATMDSAKLLTRRRFLMAAHSQEDKCIPRPNPPNPGIMSNENYQVKLSIMI